MYDLVWDGIQWVPANPWGVGARRAVPHRALARRAMMHQQQQQMQQRMMMATQQQQAFHPRMVQVPGGPCAHGACNMHPGGTFPVAPPAPIHGYPPPPAYPWGGGGGGWPAGGVPGAGGPGGPPGGGGDGGGSPQPSQFNLWVVDVQAFGTFEQGMQVTNEQQVAQGDLAQLQQQQSDQYTAVLPCLAPGSDGRITVILPDGQKPSDGQGWASSGQSCPTDPNAQSLEPVGVSPPPAAAAATGWLPTAHGWAPYFATAGY